MPAIWGIISRKGNDVTNLGASMDASMRKYKIDRFEHLSCKNAYFSCGHQYITPESHYDESPLYDEKTGILFAADIFLTNRDAIIKKLGHEGADIDFSRIGDAKLAFLCYLKFGDSFVDVIKGYFSVAVYHSGEGRVQLYADHIGHRYLAYSVTEDIVCFGSVYAPVFEGLGGRPKLCEECMAEFYLDMGPTSFKVPSLTVYSGVFHVNGAEYVNVDLRTGLTERHKYYSLKDRAVTLKLKSDEEYKQAFLETYRNCVAMLLRSDGETGVELSGGLDSASTAALAAVELEKEGKKLYGFTSVPCSDYPYKNNNKVIENERFPVEVLAKRYPNLLPAFVAEEEGCAFSGIDEYIEMFNSPIKPLINLPYLYHIPKKAFDEGCRLMLAGANGNASVSYGGIFWYMTHYLGRLDFVHAYHEMNAFCKRNSVGRKKFIKVLLGGYWERIASRFYVKFDSVLKKELVHKYSLKKLSRERISARGTYFFQNRKERINYIYNQTNFSHMAFYQTNMNLLTGVMDVDATMTVEMIEFCLSLPIDVYVKNGRERRTIRDYMDTYLPECITSEKMGRGRQAADCEFRINREWPSVSEGVIKRLQSERLEAYIDIEQVSELVRKIGKEGENGISDRATTNVCVALYALDVFLEKCEG